MHEPDRPPRPSELGPTPWRGHASVGPQFNYRREEREAQRQTARETPRGGFFRRNRGLTLTIIDLVIVAALFAIVTFVVLPLQSRGRIGSYRLRAEAVWVDGAVLATVQVIDGDFSDRDGPPPSQVVELRAGSRSSSDLVPMLNPTRLMRLRVSPSEAGDALQDDSIRLDVRIGDEVESLTAPVEGSSPPDR